jgi:hypothetical protein
MPKYRRKPIVVDAMQWDGTEEGALAIQRAFGLGVIVSRTLFDGVIMRLRTLEGGMSPFHGDFIVNVDGELSCCSPDVFEALYEAVEG